MLNFAHAYYPGELKESWFEKLNRWTEALAAYEVMMMLMMMMMMTLIHTHSNTHIHTHTHAHTHTHTAQATGGPHLPARRAGSHAVRNDRYSNTMTVTL